MTRLLVSWPGGSLEAALKLGATLVVAYILVLWLSAVAWVYRDVRTRTTDAFSQWVALILVGLFSVPGLIVYLVIRPQDTLADAYERSLEAEAILHELQGDSNSCQACRRPIEADFAICPYCRTVLREPCKSCGRLLRTNWNACPFCTTDRVPARPPAPAPRAAPATGAQTAGLQPPQRQPAQTQPRTAPTRQATPTPGSPTRQPPVAP